MDLADGDLQAGAHRFRGDGVLPWLAVASGQVDEERDVVPRLDLRDRCAVRGLEHQGDDVVGLLDGSDDPVGPGRGGGVDAGGGMEPGLFGNQLGGEEPVDLVPGCGDLGGDGVTEDLPHCGEQVMAHDRVLLWADSEGDVLVRDPRHHVGAWLARLKTRSSGWLSANIRG